MTNAKLPPSFLGMDAWMTSQLNVAFICKLTGSLMWLAYYFTFIYVCFYNQAVADILSPGAGIECLYCACILCKVCAKHALAGKFKDFSILC